MQTVLDVIGNNMPLRVKTIFVAFGLAFVVYLSYKLYKLIKDE